MSKYAKAVVAAAIAGLTALATGLDDNVVTVGEWVAVVIAALSALGITYMVPNSQVVNRSDR